MYLVGSPPFSTRYTDLEVATGTYLHTTKAQISLRGSCKQFLLCISCKYFFVAICLFVLCALTPPVRGLSFK